MIMTQLKQGKHSIMSFLFSAALFNFPHSEPYFYTIGFDAINSVNNTLFFFCFFFEYPLKSKQNLNKKMTSSLFIFPNE